MDKLKTCSVCGGKAVHDYYYDELPNEQQIEDYMQLCLHLLQRCTYMTNGEVNA